VSVNIIRQTNQMEKKTNGLFKQSFSFLLLRFLFFFSFLFLFKILF